MPQVHVLLVDDEPMILEMVGHALSAGGFRVSTAETADAAISIGETGGIDVLMTDIQMPGPMDGVALARLLRRRKPALPVLFLSGDLNGLANADGVEPPSTFLVKPFVPDDALGAIARLTGGSAPSPG